MNFLILRNYFYVAICYDASKCRDVIHSQADFIFSSTTNHYIRNIEELFMNVARYLKNGGECIFSIIHPLYSAMYPIEHGDKFPNDEEWTIRYLDKSARAYIQPWLEYNDDYENHLSKSYHHTFSDYINAIIDAPASLLKRFVSRWLPKNGKQCSRIDMRALWRHPFI